MDFEKSLQDTIFKMLCNPKYMFYGLFLAELNKNFDDKFPTACVGKHTSSSNIQLVIGKKFWEKTLFNESRKTAILIHELEHVIREHLSEVSQGLYPDKFLANMAMDISINQTITEELPRTDENGEPCGVYIESFPNLKLEKDKSSLYYYQKLTEAKEKKQNSSCKCGAKQKPQITVNGQPIGQQGQPQPGDGEQQDQEGDGSGQGQKQDPQAQAQGQQAQGSGGKKKKCTCGGKDSQGQGQAPGNGQGTSGDPNLDTWLDNEPQDWHSLWREITDGMGEKEIELLKKEIQETVRRIAEETEKQRGTVPAHIQNSIKDNFGRKEPVVSWKQLFRRFIGSTISTDIYQTRKRPNFRFEDAPSNKYKSKVRIVVGMDSSGSVSDHELKEFFSEAKHIFNAGVKVDICLWDAHVHMEYEYKGENTYERVCQGGTHASSFIEHVNENRRKKNWTVAINLTDGYIESNPIRCNIPILWVITKSGSMEFTHHGKKIKMN